MSGQIAFRQARPEDTGLILRFIRELAAYAQLEDQVVADEETLRRWILEKKGAAVGGGLGDGGVVGLAVDLGGCWTFMGRSGVYLEDLFVLPEYRGRGYGKALLCRLAAIAKEEGCGRLEWWCLDWNKPSIDFYKSMGAEPMEDWTVYRVAGETLDKLAEEAAI